MKAPLVILIAIMVFVLGFLVVYSQQRDMTVANTEKGHAAGGGYGSSAAPASGGYGTPGGAAPASGGYGTAPAANPAAAGYGAPAPKAGGHEAPAAGGYK